MAYKLVFALVSLAMFVSTVSAQDKRLLNCDYRRLESVIVTHADVPLYPPLAVQARVSGTVEVRILIKGGTIVSADAIPGANPMLSLVAKENVQTWRFTPQSYGDFCVRYEYELSSVESPTAMNPTVEMNFPERVKITTSPVESRAIPTVGGTAN
jgi:hypothetical protein